MKSVFEFQFKAAFTAWIVFFFVNPSDASESIVVTEYERNAPAWKLAEPRYVGHTFDQSWPSQGVSFSGCNIVGQPDSTAPRVLQLVGGQATVTSKNASNENICPIQDATSLAFTSDGYLGSGGSFVFEFDPPISAFYTNYGSLALGETCTMNLYSQGGFVDAITSAASLDSGLAAGHGFISPVFIDEIRITCTESGPVLIGAFRGTLGAADDLGQVCVPAYDSDCSGPSYTPIDFACVFEGSEITMGLPGVGNAPDEFIAIPRGRSVYALLVSGYAQNQNFNLLHFFNFANFVLQQGGYVHYSWWNNLLAPYMYRPLHDSQSNPGDLMADIGGFVPIPGPNGFFDDKARPEEDTQFQSDARHFLAAIKDAEPTALLVVVGHSMGGGAVARLGSQSPTPIDILAPIDPVGNRSLPVGRVGHNDYNWTRWRGDKNEFLGFKDQDCERIFGLCTLPLDCFTVGDWHDSPPGLLGGWTLTAPLCGPFVHNPSTRQFPHVQNLYHKWQTEASFPFDYDTNRYFDFTPPPGGTSIQQPVNTCASGDDPIDPSINCGPLDGHGEIVGFRHVPPEADGLAATGWSSNPNTRRGYLQAWETEGDSWTHRPPNPDLCLVSNGLISLLAGIISYQDAALVTEYERSTQNWKNAVPNRWEAYNFDQFVPGQGSSFTGCDVTGVPDPTAPRVIQLGGGQITVSAKDLSGNFVCPLYDGTSAERASDLIIPAGGTAIIEFDPPIGAFYANYGSLEAGRNVRMDLYAEDQLVDFVISAVSPAASNGVQATGHGFVSPTLIDRIEFTATEDGVVLIGGFRGVLSNTDSLGQVCIPAYSANCSTLTELDFGCVFGAGPIHNQTQPNEPFYYTINVAIEASHDGDKIECDTGVYREAVNFAGKAITLRGSTSSVIDVGSLFARSSAVTCASGEGLDTILDNFTITGGIGTLFAGERRGGGMYVNDSDPTVRNCRFLDNGASRGGGVYSGDGSPNLVNCTFIGNSANWGAGMYCAAGTSTLTNCLFVENVATTGGGGIAIEGGGNLSMANGTLTENSVLDGFGGGVLVGGESSLGTTNSIFWNNSSASSLVVENQIHVESSGFAFVMFSDIQDNDSGTGTIPFGGAVNGNMDQDPRFMNSSGGDYRLKPSSPCVDSGDDASVPPDGADLDQDGDSREVTPLDLAGSQRLFDADAGGFAKVDMGAYEFLGCRGDVDSNELIDLMDHAVIIECILNSQGVTPACRDAFDFDSNQHIDLFDFQVFQLNFGCTN